MAVQLGERPFTDIVTSVRYWIIHSLIFQHCLCRLAICSELVWRMMSLEHLDQMLLPARTAGCQLSDRFEAKNKLTSLSVSNDMTSNTNSNLNQPVQYPVYRDGWRFTPWLFKQSSFLVAIASTIIQR